MSFTYGFYNSINHDRLYDAEQVSAIFDGLIHDGVFDSIGDIFATIPGEGLQVLVGSGKAWFHHTWNVNDATLPLPIEAPDILLPRVDAVVLEVNNERATRANRIFILKGSPSSTPTKPKLVRTDVGEGINQYALAYVTVPANATEITTTNIEINVGKSDCPFVTSIVQSTDIDALFNQWNGEFDEWFENLKNQLSDDVVANLQRQIDEKVDKIKDKATSEEALAGENDTHYMTPKLVMDSIDRKVEKDIYLFPDKYYPIYPNGGVATYSYVPSGNTLTTKDYIIDVRNVKPSSGSEYFLVLMVDKEKEIFYFKKRNIDNYNTPRVHEFDYFEDIKIFCFSSSRSSGNSDVIDFYRINFNNGSPSEIERVFYKSTSSIFYNGYQSNDYCIIEYNGVYNFYNINSKREFSVTINNYETIIYIYKNYLLLKTDKSSLMLYDIDTNTQYQIITNESSTSYVKAFSDDDILYIFVSTDGVSYTVYDFSLADKTILNTYIDDKIRPIFSYNHSIYESLFNPSNDYNGYGRLITKDGFIFKNEWVLFYYNCKTHTPKFECNELNPLNTLKLSYNYYDKTTPCSLSLNSIWLPDKNIFRNLVGISGSKICYLWYSNGEIKIISYDNSKYLICTKYSLPD